MVKVGTCVSAHRGKDPNTGDEGASNSSRGGQAKWVGVGSKAKDENEIRNARKQSEVGKENMINILQ